MRYAVCRLLLVLPVAQAACAEPAPAISQFSGEKAKAHQQAWAKHLGLPVQVTNSPGMKLRLIPPGQFVMGSPQKEEWCADWYAKYPKNDLRDPTGPAKGERRVARGGCWINFPAVCRSANRGNMPPVSWNFHTGFRVVRDLR